MIGPIVNAADKDLLENTGNLPDMSTALVSWFQAIVFTRIVKTIVNFKVVESPTVCNCQGVMQPLTDQQLQMKPHGERAWKWYNLHTDTAVILEPDDTIVYKGLQYRVMAKADFKEYGYVRFSLVQDFKGAGP